jgi:DNA invertase Pin-like site-specific DNA recombinase
MNKMEQRMIIGYARVSTDGQTLDAQQTSLKAAGAERVFAEKISGAVTDRRQLARAIAALGQGDVLLVTRLDRRGAPGTCSTSSTLSQRPVPSSDRWLMLGPTPPRHMAS